MHRLSELAAQKGNIVTGSDVNLHGHNAKFVRGADRVVYTCAVSEDNPELVEARRLNIPCIERAAFLGEISADYERVIAVAGAHGKTTATAMTAAALSSLNPEIHLGGTLVARAEPVAAEKKIFLTEACEYRRAFLQLKPSLAAVLNVDLDHTDYYRDLNDVLSAFDEFVKGADGSLICGDDEVAKRLIRSSSHTFGIKGRAYYRAERIERENGGRYSFDFCIGGKTVCRVKPAACGFHNVYNALCAMSISDMYGIDGETAAHSLAAYGGVKRRFERIGELNGATVITDYAHHPREIAATIAAARTCALGRVFAVFEPHTYSRTASLSGGFSESLSKADIAVILPIFPAREKPVAGVTAIDIALNIIAGNGVAVYLDAYCLVKPFLKSRVKKDDVVLFLGAGDVDLLARTIAFSAVV